MANIAKDVISFSSAVADTSTVLDFPTLTGHSPAGVTAWELSNDGEQDIEIQFDSSAPDPVIGLKNQLRVTANSTKMLDSFVMPSNFRAIAGAGGSTLRVEGLRR